MTSPAWPRVGIWQAPLQPQESPETSGQHLEHDDSWRWHGGRLKQHVGMPGAQEAFLASQIEMRGLLLQLWKLCQAGLCAEMHLPSAAAVTGGPNTLHTDTRAVDHSCFASAGTLQGAPSSVVGDGLADADLGDRAPTVAAAGGLAPAPNTCTSLARRDCGRSAHGTSIDADDVPRGPGGSAGEPSALLVTTLMVRNIPPECTVDDLLQAWPVDGSYDFLFLPMSTGDRYAIGFAFINFVDEASSFRFEARWQSQRLPTHPKARRLRLVTARLQGQRANVHALQGQPKARQRCRLTCPIIIIKNGRLVGLQVY